MPRRGRRAADNGTLFPRNAKPTYIARGAYILTDNAQDFGAVLNLADPRNAHAAHVLSAQPGESRVSRKNPLIERTIPRAYATCPK